MPAEWARHASTWLTWPTNRTTWPGKLLAEVEGIYLDMLGALLPGEKVNLLVPDRRIAEKVLSTLACRRVGTGRLVLHPVRAVDTWIRDYGPIFVRRPDGSKAFTKWTFNAWGGKYRDLARDNGVVDRLDALRSVRRFDAGLVMEGGSLDVDGRGTCLTTEQCLLNPNRNPALNRTDLERWLRAYLGAEKVIWLKEGIEGDDTDGHVDDITRFVGASTVVTAVEPDRSDPNHAPLEENRRILAGERDARGRRLRVVELPMPGHVRLRRDRGRLPASYANFYIGNAAVLAPVYSHSNDRKALKILRRLFPGRRVVGIECTALVYGLGSIHCVTQQEPAKQI